MIYLSRHRSMPAEWVCHCSCPTSYTHSKELRMLDPLHLAFPVAMAFEKNLSSIFFRCFINQRWICQGLWDLHDRHLFYRNYRGSPGRITSSRDPWHQVSHSSPTLVMIGHLSQAHLLSLLPTHPHPHPLLVPASSGLLYPSILPRFGSFLQKKKNQQQSHFLVNPI